ncbi:hypothetical protein T02_11499 [Trichinella nativa]|uniref:Uncharacterized protein n=1 Tax=Trichinella nativa TaxID=6335 RepID=A0A0V1KJQ0_9BILA|nr:hypothetical protein T02_11499 [Trichinella nativa]
MEMKIDDNLSVHQRTSRFRSDNENNNTDERDGGAKRRLQANSEAKRNLISWADNSQTNAEVMRKCSDEKV